MKGAHLDASLYEPAISAQTSTGTDHVLPQAGPIGILNDVRTAGLIEEWLAAAGLQAP